MRLTKERLDNIRNMTIDNEWCDLDDARKELLAEIDALKFECDCLKAENEANMRMIFTGKVRNWFGILR